MPNEMAGYNVYATTDYIEGLLDSNLETAKSYTDEKVTEINTALNGKEIAGAAAQALIDAKVYTDQEVANLVGSAPETLDTIEELATAFQENEDIIETLNQAIGNKADKTELDKKPGLKYSNKEIDYQYYDGTQWVTIKGYASPDNPEIFNDYTNNIASGSYSHAEGENTLSCGWASHAEGARTQASGSESHAEGEETKAIGISSHTEGVYTTAIGNGSHAEGMSAKTKGNYSHAEGLATMASGLYQHVQGKYNIEDTESKYAHIVGNGEDYATPSNAHTLDWQGNAWFAGNITLGPDNKEVATKADLESINSNIKTVSYENTVFATQEGQTVFNIGIGSFDATTDKLDVHDGRLYLTRNLDYTVSGQTVTLTEGVGNGDSVTFTVLKNVPVLEEEITISPSLLENGSIPLSKLQTLPTAADIDTYTKAEVDAIVANAVAAVKAEIMASLTVTSDVPMTFGITDDGGLSVTYDDQAVNT